MAWKVNQEEPDEDAQWADVDYSREQKRVFRQWVDVRTEMNFLERSRRRKPGAVRAHERYLRRDIHCGIANCNVCRQRSGEVMFRPKRLMQRENATYIVPDAFSLLQCMELLEEELFGRVAPHLLVLETVYAEALRIAPTRDATRLKNLFHEDRRMVADCCIYFFADQHHVETYAESALMETDNGNVQLESLRSRDDRALLKTLLWYQDGHISSSSHIIYMAKDPQSDLSKLVMELTGEEVLTCEEYLDKTLKNNVGGANFLKEFARNTAEAIIWWQERRVVDENGVVMLSNGEFAPHLPLSQLKERVARHELFKGKLEVSSHNPVEAFVMIEGHGFGNQQMEKVFVYGRDSMNRGVHGDVVVVELLPKSQWRTPQSDRMLVHYSTDDNEENSKQRRENSNNITEENSETNPTGFIVGILDRSPRFHVATVLSSTVGPNDDYALAIPMDARIPKIRIRSQRMDTLVDKRLKVVIDHWAVDSMYPNGHYVGVLGTTGSLSTELSALLVQNEIEEAPFSEAALACLPECDIEGNKIAECSTAKRPQFCKLLDWQVQSEEVSARRDLRSTHRVFSVDPPGCQDIDDAMSVRLLDNGNIELGVHIADVSYFVSHESPLDYEARSRATTVYLVGQRLDMLPSVLSADLCSLHQNVDRLAVSVIWELDGRTYDIIEDKTWFGRTIIRSCASMTYEQAHRLLQGLNADGGNQKRSGHLPSSSATSSSVPIGVAGGLIPLELQREIQHDLVVLTNISRKLARTRGEHGGLNLSKQEEMGFSLNVTELGEEGVEIIVKESLEIHNTIAELMILANSCVAKRIVDIFPTNALLRRHPPPSGDRFTQLIKIALAKDIVIDASNNFTLQQSLATAQKSGNVDSKTMELLKSLAVRVMTEAEYICSSEARATSNKNNDSTSFAHYGLGLQYYTHFTSPIRRYADIIVHRQLLSSITVDKGKNAKHAQLLHIGTKSRVGELTAESSISLPTSLVPSVLNDDVDFLDDLIATVDSKLNVTAGVIDDEKMSLPSVQIANDTEILFPPNELVPLTKQLNKKNRNAKLAARDCDQLFLALYFSSHTVKVQAIITTLKQNGFIVYIPKYDIRAPVYIRDKDGFVQMDPLLCGVRIVDTQPPTGAFANANWIRMIPQAHINFEADTERLEVVSPDGSCVFKILDEVEVQVSCDLSASTARVPQLQLLLVGLVKPKKGQRREMRLVHNYAECAVIEAQRVVQKNHDLENGHRQGTVNNLEEKNAISCEVPKKANLYEILNVPIQTLSPVKSKVSRKTSKTGSSKQPLMNKRGPGRLVFGDYQPPTRQHYSQKLAHYMDNRSEELEQELSIQRFGSSSTSTQDMRSIERDAMSRTQKLAAERRHDRINKRNKAAK